MPREYKVDNVIKVIKKSQINEVQDGELFIVTDDDQVIDDAPSDGKAYARKDGVWEELVIPAEWVPNYTWWDIKAELENDDSIGEDSVYKNAYIYLCKDNSPVISFTINAEDCVKVTTSDGSEYDEEGEFTHTWTGENDKQCDESGVETYKTRWVKVYVAKEDDYTMQNNLDKQVIGVCFKGVGGTTTTFGHAHNLIFIQSLTDKWIGRGRETISSLFNYCYNLIFIEEFDSTNIRNCNYSFNDCHKLVKLPIKDFTNVTMAGHMCENCSSLLKVDLLNSDKIIDYTNVFAKCQSLERITNMNVGFYDGSTDEYVKNTYAFAGCKSLTSLTMIGKVRKVEDYMFASNYNLSEVFVDEESLEVSFNPSSNIMRLSKKSLLSLLKGCSPTAVGKILTIGSGNKENLELWLDTDGNNGELTQAHHKAVYEYGWAIV